jgi:L-threonylcarbamoyladenylate synthase
MPRVSLPDLIAGIATGHAVASFPTDTVPALAVRPDCADRLFALKQRSADKPLILMAGEVDDLWSYVTGTPEARAIWQNMARSHWPGALTLVLPASDRVPPALNPQDPSTIGVRVPNHALAQTILRQTGPLATTSANLSGQPALLSLDEIVQQFPGVLTLAPEELGTLEGSLGTMQIPDGMTSGTPSTVLRWTGNGWTILRQGAVVLDLG